MADEKRRHKTLSIEEKLKVLKRIDGGASLSCLAKEYDIGRSTVSDIKKNEDKLKNFASSMESFAVDSKSRKISLAWYECQDECTAPSLMVLKNVRDLAARKRFSNAKQLTLDSYFHST